MGKINKPRAGSLAFNPRKRSRDQTPRIRSWRYTEKPQLLGFPSYKVGMRSVGMIDDSQAPTKGMEIATSVTVLETPKITIYGVRLYKETITGTKCLGDAVVSDTKITGKLGMKKDTKHKDLEWVKKNATDKSYLAILAFTNVKDAGTPKKSIDVVEIGLGGKTFDEQFEYAKGLFGKEVGISDVFVDGEIVDAVAVTRGHGWQGAIKRFGASKQRRKSTNRVRHIGCLGPWHPAYVMYTARQAGQHGFHRRTQYNNRILTVGKDPKEINTSSGFAHYGVVKTDYVVVKGSIPGAQKRFVFLRKGMRVKEEAIPVKPKLSWTN